MITKNTFLIIVFVYAAAILAFSVLVGAFGAEVRGGTEAEQPAAP